MRPRAVYSCKYCSEILDTGAALGGHVGAQHPERRRQRPACRITSSFIPARGPRPGGSLKSDADTWPARP